MLNTNISIQVYVYAPLWSKYSNCKHSFRLTKCHLVRRIPSLYCNCYSL